VYINNAISNVCQDTRFWAKFTKFKSGQFEMSVIRPRLLPEGGEVHLHAGRDCVSSFGGTPDYDAPYAPVMPRKCFVELTEEERAAKDTQNLERTVRRARGAIRRLIKSLEADHMLTFSYRENMQDVDRLKADWKKFLRLMRGRYPKWQFVAIREKQERGAYHLHVAVKGKQDIKWLLRCWLVAIGQDWDDVQQWYVHGLALGDKSLGAVNVRAPSKRWGEEGKRWRPEKLAGYLTKYLGKEFQEISEHYSMRYWHSKGIVKPQVVKFWLGATQFGSAVHEAHDFCFYKGAVNISLWGADDWENLYISGDGIQLDLEITEFDF
jgi:hypothetical protein